MYFDKIQGRDIITIEYVCCSLFAVRGELKSNSAMQTPEMLIELLLINVLTANYHRQILGRFLQAIR